MYKHPPAVSYIDKLNGLFFERNALKVITRQFIKLGKTYSLASPMFPYRLIFTKDPDLITYFLQKNHKNYEKSIYQTEKLGKFIGKGLLTNYGKDWKRQRKLIQPGFGRKKIEALNHIILSEIQSFFDDIPKNKEIDLYEYLNQLAFNVVAKSLFSSNISKEEINIISSVLTKSQEFYIKETIHPIVEFYLKKSGKTKKMLNELKEVRTIFLKLINERKKDSAKDDLLSFMLDAKYEDTNQTMTNEQLIDELLILFIAGHETTANALSFTFYLLGKHPDHVTELKKEIKLLGNQIFDLDTLFRPSYTQHILKESMRLYPPAWVMDRQAKEDDAFGNYSWKKGSILVGCTYAMNRNDSIWKDATTFNPLRFTEDDARKKVNIPFGSGPRYCIGEHFAMLEMSLVLRHFYTEYDFILKQKNIELIPLVTLRPKTLMGKIVEKN